MSCTNTHILLSLSICTVQIETNYPLSHVTLPLVSSRSVVGQTCVKYRLAHSSPVCFILLVVADGWSLLPRVFQSGWSLKYRWLYYFPITNTSSDRPRHLRLVFTGTLTRHNVLIVRMALCLKGPICKRVDYWSFPTHQKLTLWVSKLLTYWCSGLVAVPTDQAKTSLFDEFRSRINNKLSNK